MSLEAVRSILGVWMPLVIGGWIVLTAVLFYLTAPADIAGEARIGSTLLVAAIGGLLVLSTLGRYRKVRAARVEETNRATR